MCALPKNIAATKKWPCGQPNNHSAAALHLVPPLQYDVVKDFEPVLLLADAPLLLVASKAVPANDLREFIAWLKLNPDKSSMGTVGAGSPGHLLGLLLQKETGTRFGLVAYRGAGPAMQDVVAGQIETTFANTATSLPHVRAGSAKAFAVTAKKRLAVAPGAHRHLGSARGLGPRGPVTRAGAGPVVSKISQRWTAGTAGHLYS